MEGLPRVFRTIQKDRRVVIPEEMMSHLGWSEGDPIIIERYRGKIIIENLNGTIKPLEERI